MMKVPSLRFGLVFSVFALSLASVGVIIWGLAEPFLDFRKSDVVVLVGVALIVMTLWLQVAVVLVYGVASGRLPPSWLLLLVWVLICGLYLQQCPTGYLHNLAEIVKRH